MEDEAYFNMMMQCTYRVFAAPGQWTQGTWWMMPVWPGRDV